MSKMILNEVKLYQKPIITESISVNNKEKPKKFKLNLIECDV